MTAPEDMTLAEASAAIRRKRISPVEYLDALRARFDALEPRLNTTVRPLWDDARTEAQKATRRIARSGPRSAIDGLPIGLKDIIDLKGHPTTCHSRHLLDNVKQDDAAAGRPSTCPSRRRATRGTRRIIQAGRRRVRAPRSARASCRPRSAPTPAGRCATPPAIAASSA
jgi:hypothetical protein